MDTTKRENANAHLLFDVETPFILLGGDKRLFQILNFQPWHAQREVGTSMARKTNG